MKKYKVIKNIPFVAKKGDVFPANDLGYICYNGEPVDPLSWPEYFKEIKEPLFVTEDGVELFDENYCVFGVCPKGNWQTNYYSGGGIPIYMIFPIKSNSWLYFSTKEAAEKFIDENKPMFSKKQILDAEKEISLDYKSAERGINPYGADNNYPRKIIQLADNLYFKTLNNKLGVHE